MRNPVDVPCASVNRFALAACIVAASGGLLWGLDMGIIAGALHLVIKNYLLNDQLAGCVVSMMMLGAAAGALSGGGISSRFGRRGSLLLCGSLFVVGNTLCAAAPSISVLLAGRLLTGIAIGLASFVAPLYISEIAPARARGAMVATYQLMITVGIVGGFLSDLLLGDIGSWRLMLGVTCIPALLFLVGTFFIPESPRWLILQLRLSEAGIVALKLGAGGVEAIDANTQERSRSSKGWRLLKTNPNFRRAVALGIGLQMLQQLTGISVVMYYAPQILRLAGLSSSHDQILGTTIIGVVNVIATIASMMFVDRWGRKPVLLAGCTLMTLAMGGLAVALGSGSVSPFAGVCAVLLLVVFVIAFAVSAGPLVWILCSEIQPAIGRDFGITISTLTSWMTSMAVTSTFLTLIRWLGQAQTFGIYATFNALFILVAIGFVPETKNRTLERIESNLMQGKPLRRLGI